MLFFDDQIQKSTDRKSPKSKVLGVGGSPRKGGNSDVILKNILKGVTGKKITTDSQQLRNFQYQGCIGCEK